ncbi:endonuclease/exonuclease/phosphatase family protein [Paludisphaera rhizosphaerae]|uniref:endonuclease/exonuclease/phosphatase family protein n=1 Tax=Paludisphaera rhizosphaerae TaxID=2711216 RepID=UPI0013EC72D9|nr:endonuclease/exonuclease/phosphatase family protein [Paludisphaera rhizosphaerae]
MIRRILSVLALSLFPAFAAAEEPLRLATFNIHHAEGTDGKLDLKRVADLVRGADIVAFQEVDVRFRDRSGKVDQAAALGDLLRANVAFGGNLIDADGGQYGVALVSRFPIVAHQNHRLPRSAGREKAEPRGLLECRLDVNGRPLRVFVTHLAHDSAADKALQVARVREVLAACPDPWIMMGDFNFRPDSDDYKALTAAPAGGERIVDGWPIAGKGEGHSIGLHGSRPGRIDYVFVSGSLAAGIVAGSGRVDVETVASDHQPVYIQLTVPAATAAKAANVAPTGDPTVVLKTPGLVGFWTFGEEAGMPRVSTGTKEPHPLTEVGGPIPRVAGGPYSGRAAELDGKHYFRIPYAETGDLNIAGSNAQVSMFAVVRVENLKQSRTIAGMWTEGKGANDDSGTRQYAMLMNMPTYGGPRRLVPHVSSEGGVTRRADGSAFPWCADYAVTPREVPESRWCSLAFTYDGQWLKAYIDGRLEPMGLDPARDRRNDRYFTAEGPDGRDRGMNPYYHGRGIFRYDPSRHAATKPGGGSDFTVGARHAVGTMLGEATIGRFGGLAVFNRALSDDEIRALHDSARVEAIEPR